MSDEKDKSNANSHSKEVFLMKGADTHPTKFYEVVALDAVKEGHVILLDGKVIQTPAGNELLVPSLPLAKKIAAEWEAQDDKVIPDTLPLTKLANTAIDGVVGREREVIEDIVSFASSDLICYRAEEPQELVMKQIAQWDPVLEWVAQGLGATFNTTFGVMHIQQPEESLQRIRSTIAEFDAFSLTPMHSMATLMGSTLLMLALLAGRIDLQSAWQSAHLDEDWQISKWGWDEETKARRESRWWEMDAASRFYNLLHLDDNG
jgi:chaperone required for assembly of F1-ATPase